MTANALNVQNVINRLLNTDCWTLATGMFGHTTTTTCYFRPAQLIRRSTLTTHRQQVRERLSHHVMSHSSSSSNSNSVSEFYLRWFVRLSGLLAQRHRTLVASAMSVSSVEAIIAEREAVIRTTVVKYWPRVGHFPAEILRIFPTWKFLLSTISAQYCFQYWTNIAGFIHSFIHWLTISSLRVGDNTLLTILYWWTSATPRYMS